VDFLQKVFFRGLFDQKVFATARLFPASAVTIRQFGSVRMDLSLRRVPRGIPSPPF
jgi:hypothetical protein